MYTVNLKGLLHIITNCYTTVRLSGNFYDKVPYCGPPWKIKREKEVFQFKVLNPSIIMSGGFLPLTAVHLK